MRDVRSTGMVRIERSRYAGSQPFTDSEADRARYFGREVECEQLYLRVLSVPLLVQFGRSGLGKTSLLQAGLFEPLRKKKALLPVMIRLNTAGESLMSAVVRSMRQACEAEGLELTEGQGSSLKEWIASTTVWRDDLLLTPVLVFDQFEEVFTLKDAAFRANLATELATLAFGGAGSPVVAPAEAGSRPVAKVVISLREDYLGSLQEFSAAIPSLFHERLRLEPLSDESAKDAISEPANLPSNTKGLEYSVPRFKFDPLLLNSIIAYLKGRSGIIEPFQLQLLCRHAETIAAQKTRGADESLELESSDFQGNRGFDSVLENFYLDVITRLPAGQRGKARKLCEEGLLNESGHRLPLDEGQIRGDYKVTAATLELLTQERLLRRELRLESVFYEISHDRLAESIAASRPFRLPRKLRRVLVFAAVVAPLILIGLGFWLISLDEARRQAEDARQQAEGLLSFLLGESFLGEVRDTGRSELLEQVTQQTADYARAGFTTPSAILNRGLALRNAGQFKRTRGRLSESVTDYEQALAVLSLDSSGIDSIRREMARTHERLGEAQLAQGKLTNALSAVDSAVSTWRGVVKSGSLEWDDCATLAESLITAADLRSQLGEITEAVRYLNEALQISVAGLLGRQTPQSECLAASEGRESFPELQTRALSRTDYKTFQVLSEAVLLEANIRYWQEDFDGAMSLANEAKRLRPSSSTAAMGVSFALANRGNAQFFSKPQTALQDYEQVLGEFDVWQRWDPDNVQWQRERAAVQLLIVDLAIACIRGEVKDCGPKISLDDAEPRVLEAIATLRGLLQVPKVDENVSWRRDLGWALQSYASLLSLRDRSEESLEALQEAEQSYLNALPDSADADGHARLGLLVISMAKMLESLQRSADALQIAQRASAIFEKLADAHPKNPNYRFHLRTALELEATLHTATGQAAAAATTRSKAEQLPADQDSLFGELEAGIPAALYVDPLNKAAEQFEREEYPQSLAALVAIEHVLLQEASQRPSDYLRFDALSNIYAWIAAVHAKLNQQPQQTAALNSSLRAMRMAALFAPPDQGLRQDMKRRHAKQLRDYVALLYDADSRHDEALSVVQEQVSVTDELVRSSPKNADHLVSAGTAKIWLGAVRRKLGRAGWEESVRGGLVHLEQAVDLDGASASNLIELGASRWFLAGELRADGREADALDEFKLALNAYREASAASKVPDKVVDDAIGELQAQLAP